MGSASLGQRVNVRGEPGVVRYVGTAQFAPGEWVGVELDRPHGRNDGSVQGVRYFECQNDGSHGVFVRSDALDQRVHEGLGSLTGPDAKAVVNKLQVKLKAAVEEIGRSKETIALLSDELDLNKLLCDQLEASVELSAVEQEYLKGQNSDLLQLLESLREKYDHLSADFSIVNEELEIHKALEAAVSSLSPQGPVSSDDYQILLQHNKKLELALTSLRKVSEEAQASKAETLALLSAKTGALASLEEAHGDLAQKLRASELVIVQLQEELEISAELSLIIEYLTSENEALQNKIQELTESVKELTELHEMDKTIEENHMIEEQEFKELIGKLTKEIESHKLQLNKLRDVNVRLMTEQNGLKKKLKDENLDISPQEFEQLTLNAKMLQTRDLQLSFANTILQDKLSLISAFPSQLVPITYRDQTSLLVEIQKCISSCSSLLLQLNGLPFTSLMCNVCYIVQRLETALLYSKNSMEYAHVNPQEHLSKVKTLIDRLSSDLGSSISQYIPEDLFTIDLAFASDSVEAIETICENSTVPRSIRPRYYLTCLANEILFVTDMARHIYTAFALEKLELNGFTKDLSEFITVGLDLARQVTKLIKSIDEASDKDLCEGQFVSPRNLGLFSLFLTVSKKIESEIGLEEEDVFEKFRESNFDLNQSTQSLKILLDELPRDLRFEKKIFCSVFDILAGISANHASVNTKETSKLESQLIEKTELIQNLYLQIELLEKNMFSSLAGKEMDLKNTKDTLNKVKKDYKLLEQQLEDLLQANKSLLVQLETFQSSDHFSEYQQIPVFENLKAMRDYTSKMALVDEINLLKKMVRGVRTTPSVSQLNEDWLDVPLTRRKSFVKNGPGVELFQMAQKKRKEALAILRTILATPTH